MGPEQPPTRQRGGGLGAAKGRESLPFFRAAAVALVVNVILIVAGGDTADTVGAAFLVAAVVLLACGAYVRWSTRP